MIRLLGVTLLALAVVQADLLEECQEIMILDSSAKLFPDLQQLCRTYAASSILNIPASTGLDKRGYDFIRFGKRDGGIDQRSDYDYIRFGKRRMQPINVRFGKRAGTEEQKKKAK